MILVYILVTFPLWIGPVILLGIGVQLVVNFCRKPKLESPDFLCRVYGHQDYVPSGGGYPGMPQSHCYYCGKKNYNASEWCTEWSEPISFRPFWQFVARWQDVLVKMRRTQFKKHP